VYYFERLLADVPARRGPVVVRAPLAAHAQNLLFRTARLLPALPGLEYYKRARRRFDRAELEQTERRVAAATASIPNGLSREDLAELDRVNS
jgi:hypothetical protein